MQRRTISNSPAFGRYERVPFGFIAVAWIILGLTFGTLILGLGALVALAVGVRTWWLRQRSHRVGVAPGVTVIDGEYVVLEERREYRQGGSDA